MWMHATMESVLSWNNKTPKGSGSLALNFSRKLEGKDGKGERAWSTREQETDALVSSLPKFINWNWGTKSHRVHRPQVFGESVQGKSLYPLRALREAWPVA